MVICGSACHKHISCMEFLVASSMTLGLLLSHEFARHGARSSEHALQDEVFAAAQAHRILKQGASVAPAWFGNLSELNSNDSRWLSRS